MNQDDFRRWRKNLIKVSLKLENCWGHHGDGSDLLVNEHELFNIVYNEIKPLLRKTIQEIHSETGDKAGKDWNCDNCGIKRDYGGGCKYCEEASKKEAQNE